MPNRDIIVIGASAGGVEALLNVAGGLPSDLPAAVFVVLHIPAQAPSLLPTILSRAGPLPAQHAEDGMLIQNGRIYVAPPDHHLLVGQGFVRVVHGPRENRHRPAVDPLFRTAAVAYGSRVIGVVLSGSMDDGTAGLLAVKMRGGIAVVQDPADALYPDMPRNAMHQVQVDYSMPVTEIGGLLVDLSHSPAADDTTPVPEGMAIEARIAEMDPVAMADDTRPGTPSVFSCPECNGVLYEIRDGEITRFRCRVGHAFSPESVLAEQDEALEEALYMALNTLEESASLSRRMAQQARQRGSTWMTRRFEEKVREAEQRANVIRQVLLRSDPLNPPGDAEVAPHTHYHTRPAPPADQ